MTTDPLHDALRDATLSVLLGSTNVPHQTVDQYGNSVVGTITIESAFGSQIRSRAHKGEFDNLINQAIALLTPEDLAGALKGVIAEQMLKGLENKTGGYGSTPTPGWLQQRVRDLAIEAATQAIGADENLLETLRQRIGMEVDRNRVGINVSLSDPES